ncbi:MAG: tetratricopeptide repeat protein [Candidatus Sumerlaeia bacterium]|nr:tetratricopeptide repeat protein [Candidatus Sumerlaeia bacterium]
MKAFLHIVFFIFLQSLVLAGNPADDLKAAEIEVENQNYAQALELIAPHLSLYQSNSAFHHNLGYLYGKKGDVASAVFHYRKALELNPNQTESRTNLLLIQPAINTSVDDSLGRASLQLLFLESPRWFWMLIVQISVLLLFVRLLKRPAPEPDLFVLRVQFISLAIFVFGSSGVLYFHETARDEGIDAIVMKENTRVLAGPGEQYLEVLKAPAGATVTLLERPEDGWTKVRFANGLAGFIPVQELRGL